MAEIENIAENNSYYAVRSSSIEEDSSNFSFAGQFETYLYIKKENIIEKVKEVWISSFSSHVMKYRKEGKVVYYSLEDEHVKHIVDEAISHISEKK